MADVERMAAHLERVADATRRGRLLVQDDQNRLERGGRSHRRRTFNTRQRGDCKSRRRRTPVRKVAMDGGVRPRGPADGGPPPQARICVAPNRRGWLPTGWRGPAPPHGCPP